MGLQVHAAFACGIVQRNQHPCLCVLAAVGLWNFLVAGTMKSFGLFYLEWLELYGESPVTTSWVGSLFCLLLTIGGIFSAIVDTPILNLLSLYFKNRRALASGIAFSGSSVGGLVLPLLIGWANEKYSVRGSVMLLGGLWLNVLVVGAVMFPLPSTTKLDTITYEVEENEAIGTLDPDAHSKESTYQAPGSKPAEEVTGTGLRAFCIQGLREAVQFFQIPHLLSLMLTALTASFGYYNQFFILPPFVTEIGMTKRTASWIIASISIIELFSRILVGIVADRLKRRKVWIPFIGLVVSFAAGLVVSLVPSRNLIFAYIPFFGLFGGVFSPLVIPLMVELVPSERIGTATGLYPLLVGTGTAVGIPLLGVMYEKTSSYQPCFLVCISTYLVAIVCLTVHMFRNVVFVPKSKSLNASYPA
ncbi:hypothetical protein CAPTEDRAFT_211969 [Capitella teleta]|uniref:Major facilitator superfamily (MFS) profile domain-containing protein n=1 Tax=Capitella teleta TaxID=283909 RepID=R7TP13_CAPTE|nr:hypothetical protein CAPTEDRAFT_211969 [Capitella teleta]|eukprot:ELT93266.1 hypothetical protein CAPTEDRAFT_211969 [Capitella teleta]